MKKGILLVLISVVILLFIAFGLRRLLDRVVKVQEAHEYAQSWAGEVNITNEEVLREKDGTFYLHVEDPKDFNRVSVWPIRPNHPSYRFLEAMAESSASGQQVSVDLRMSDPDKLPTTESESYIRADTGILVPRE